MLPSGLLLEAQPLPGILLCARELPASSVCPCELQARVCPRELPAHRVCGPRLPALLPCPHLQAPPLWNPFLLLTNHPENQFSAVDLERPLLV